LATLYQKLDFLYFGPHSQPSAPIDVKFCTAKQTQVPVGPGKFDLNRCNESPLRGEKPDFWPVSKNNTGILPLCGNPAGNQPTRTDVQLRRGWTHIRLYSHARTHTRPNINSVVFVSNNNATTR